MFLEKKQQDSPLKELHATRSWLIAIRMLKNVKSIVDMWRGSKRAHLTHSIDSNCFGQKLAKNFLSTALYWKH